MDNKETAWFDYKEIKKERKKERKGKHKTFWITPTWRRKAIDGECQSGSFDELSSFEKERQKAKIWVFALLPQGEAFDFLFIVKTQQMTRLWRWSSSSLHAA
jgi:hypothetical protein